jgi:hypothetical protein
MRAPCSNNSHLPLTEHHLESGDCKEFQPCIECINILAETWLRISEKADFWRNVENLREKLQERKTGTHFSSCM